MNLQEARARWLADKAMHERRGVIALPTVMRYLTEDEKHDFRIAMDAQPTLVTDPSAAIPAILTTTIDPEVYRVVYAPLSFAKILGERASGSWTDQTRMFPVVEETGEVSSYGDFNNNGRAGINMNWPQFQAYLFQCFVRYGELELERAGLAKINYVSELNQAAADLLNRFQNLSYAFGIAGLQNYGYINNPYLSAFLTPATKAAGGTTWFTAGGSPNATPNEVYNDILALIQKLIQQGNGAIDDESPMTLSLSPSSNQALKFANSFGVFVKDLLTQGYPNLKIMTAPQYGQQSTTNPQGYSTAGNVMQIKVDTIQRQTIAYAAYNEKLRAHKIIPEPSAWMQKFTSGTWGTITRMPVGVAGMIGI
jgi:hypothetical protein